MSVQLQSMKKHFIFNSLELQLVLITNQKHTQECQLILSERKLEQKTKTLPELYDQQKQGKAGKKLLQ